MKWKKSTSSSYCLTHFYLQATTLTSLNLFHLMSIHFHFSYTCTQHIYLIIFFSYTQHLRHYKMSVKCLYLHLYKMLQTFHFNSSSSWLFHSAHTNSLYICYKFFANLPFHLCSLSMILLLLVKSFLLFLKNKMGMKWKNMMRASFWSRWMDGGVTTKYFYESSVFCGCWSAFW